MFLNPLMLFGITAISIPIIIHLLNKRQFDHVQWAAMRFLKVSIEQNQRRLQLEDLLLLLLRCLMIALLAIALARPALNSSAVGGLFGGSSVNAVIVVDNSYSMGASDGVTTRFELAKKAAEQVIELLPTGSSTAVIMASDAPDMLIPEPTFDLGLARSVIHDAKLSGRGTDLYSSLRQAIEILQRKPAIRREVYFVTDGQAQGFRQFENMRKLLDETQQEIKTTLILARTKVDENVGVSSLKMSAGLCVVGQPQRFDVQVKNFSEIEARDVRVSLAVDGGSPVDETTIDLINPGSTRSVTMFAKMKEVGTHAVTASIAPDRLPTDDSRSVAVRAVSQVKVLLVDGDPGREPRESETFFLRYALQPVAASEMENYYVKTTTIQSSDLPSAQFDDFDAVYLCNVPDLAPKTVVSLADYVKRGFGLVVFPGDRTLPSFYNEELFKKIPLLPAQFGDARCDEKEQDKGFTLRGTQLTHPIATLWTDPEAGNLASAKFYKALTLVEQQVAAGPKLPGKPDAKLQPTDPTAPQVVLRFADGTPAMMERAYGRGRVVEFASTADTLWNDLPVRPGIFVPLMYRTLGTLVARQDEALTFPVGEKLAYRVGADVLGRDVVFTPPGEKPDKSAGKIEMVDGAPTLAFDQASAAGAYDAMIGTGAEATHVRFAAQPDTAESDLAAIDPSQIETLSKSASVVIYPDANLEQKIAKSRLGTELWFPLAIAALICAVGETFMADWFSRSR